MLGIILIGIIVVAAVVAVLALFKFAFKFGLAIAIVALVVFGGVYMFTGKAGLDKTIGITGAAITDAKDSEAVKDVTGAVKETAGEIIDAGREKAEEILNESEES